MISFQTNSGGLPGGCFRKIWPDLQELFLNLVWALLRTKLTKKECVSSVCVFWWFWCLEELVGFMEKNTITKDEKHNHFGGWKQKNQLLSSSLFYHWGLYEPVGLLVFFVGALRPDESEVRNKKPTGGVNGWRLRAPIGHHLWVVWSVNVIYIPRWWQLKYVLCSPRKLGKWSNLTIIFFNWVETTN